MKWSLIYPQQSHRGLSISAILRNFPSFIFNLHLTILTNFKPCLCFIFENLGLYFGNIPEESKQNCICFCDFICVFIFKPWSEGPFSQYLRNELHRMRENWILKGTDLWKLTKTVLNAGKSQVFSLATFHKICDSQSFAQIWFAHCLIGNWQLESECSLTYILIFVELYLTNKYKLVFSRPISCKTKAIRDFK